MGSAHEDAKTIRNAIKGLGTDDEKLVNVIARRTNEQLQQVTAEYISSFGKSIFDDIKGDTSGNYRDLLIALVEARPNYIARVVHEAVKGAGTDDNALIDALIHTPNYLIRAAADAYQKLYHKSIVDDVSSDTSGDYKRLLVGLLQGSRDESPNVDPGRAAADAEHLYKKGEGKIGTDEDAFIQFFLGRSPAHVQAVNELYRQKRGHDLTKAIHSEFSGNIRNALKGLTVPRHEYWAKRIHQAISGLGTNDNLLIRAFVLNDRQQLRQIDAAYSAHHAKKKDKKSKKEKKRTVSGSLVADIKGDTSGWYEKTLLALFD